MKTNIIIVALVVTLLQIAHAREIVIAVSPSLEDSVQEEVYRDVLTLALQGSVPGDSIYILDGWSANPVTIFTVTNNPAYAHNPKARAVAMQAAIKSFHAWLTTKPENFDSIPKCGIRPNAITDYCASLTNVQKSGGSVILIGSTLYEDPAEPAFSMRDGFYPSDGHVSASRQESVFGLNGQEKRLEKVSIDWASVGATYQDDGHRSSVIRWWTLYLQSQGANLMSCDSSLSAVFHRFGTGDGAGLVHVTPDPNSKLEMRHSPIRIRIPASTTTNPQSPNQATPLPISAQSPSIDFMLREDIETHSLNAEIIKNCRIGIQWPGNRDIDLYVRPSADTQELYYNQNRSPQGIHIKDWQTSPEVQNNGFETVELRGEIDLTKLAIAINFYTGDRSPGGVDGKIRLETAGKVYLMPFHIRSTDGNKGRDSSNRATSPYWIVIDPMELTLQR